MSDRLVYSTDSGRISNCPTCGLPYKQCRCTDPGAMEHVPGAKKGDDVVRVMRDRKHRSGKTVTVITGIPAGNDIAMLAQQLKKLCGSGGTIKEGTIEIQGDHCEKVEARLAQLGYKVKHAGG
jgi:translation initiation factor 1